MHVQILTTGLIGMISFDLTLFAVCYHVVPIGDIFHIDLNELEQFLTENDIKVKKNREKVKALLKDIYQNHR